VRRERCSVFLGAHEPSFAVCRKNEEKKRNQSLASEVAATHTHTHTSLLSSYTTYARTKGSGGSFCGAIISRAGDVTPRFVLIVGEARAAGDFPFCFPVVRSFARASRTRSTLSTTTPPPPQSFRARARTNRYAAGVHTHTRWTARGPDDGTVAPPPLETEGKRFVFFQRTARFDRPFGRY